MSEMPSSTRRALAEKLRGLRDAIAESVTEEFFHQHPDWLERYGERGRRHGVEDARFHLDFLAGAVEAGSPGTFADYARWAVRVLSGRGIQPRFVVENLSQVGQALLPYLGEEEQAHIARLVREACAAAEEGPTPQGGLAGDDRLALTRSLFLQAILHGGRKAACNVVTEAVRAGHPVVDLYTLVLQEALYEVGRLWEANRITVAVEHMATAIVQFVMAQLYPLLPPPGHQGRGNAVITGVEGELHQVGANMVADVLESAGWNVRFLGTNMPLAGILQVVEDHKAEVVGVSATMLFNLLKVRRLVGDIRARFAARPPRILVGGGAFRSLTAPAEVVGADGFAADLQSALALLGG